jgi:Ca-activated chloride channel family protein
MKCIVIIAMMIVVVPATAQKVNESIQAGNQLYRQQQYEKAEKEYAAAVNSQPSNTTAKLNLANTIYRRGREDEAIKGYDEVAAAEKNADLRAQSFYNKGAVLSKQKKLEESIEAYKNALRQNPNDAQARENLQKALLELKKKQPPPEKKEDKKKKKQEQQKQKEQQRPRMNQKEAEQRLKLLEQKEKEVQQRLQKEKSRTGGSQAKDW